VAADEAIRSTQFTPSRARKSSTCQRKEMPEGVDNLGNFAEAGGPAQGLVSLEDRKPNMPGLVQSGHSWPNAQNRAVEGPALSPADKKRNRLPYQRTAVACGQFPFPTLPEATSLTTYRPLSAAQDPLRPCFQRHERSMPEL
jgi:hypothetical protein